MKTAGLKVGEIQMQWQYKHSAKEVSQPNLKHHHRLQSHHQNEL